MPRLAGGGRLPWQPDAPRRDVSAHQPRFRWQTTPHAILQPLQQPRPYPCHPVGRSVNRTQRIPQGQVWRETRRIRRISFRAPHRRLRRIRHPLHQLREIPRPRHRQCASKRHALTICCLLQAKTYVSARQNNTNCSTKEYLLRGKTMSPFRLNIASSVPISARKLSFLPFFLFGAVK